MSLAAVALEDRGIHGKARTRGLDDRVYTIQTAEDWLRRLHEPRQVSLPNIQDVPLHSLAPQLATSFFDSLREGYDGFDNWFKGKAQDGRRAWSYRDENDLLAAICIYAVQSDEEINDAGERLPGQALKLCTFKVGETDKYGNSGDFAPPVTIPKGASFKDMIALKGKSDIGNKINTQVIQPLS